MPGRAVTQGVLESWWWCWGMRGPGLGDRIGFAMVDQSRKRGRSLDPMPIPHHHSVHITFASLPVLADLAVLVRWRDRWHRLPRPLS